MVKVATQKILEKFLKTSHQKSERQRLTNSIKTANEYLGRKLPGSENLLSSTGWKGEQANIRF